MTHPAGLDLIELSGLSAIGHHGVFEHERRDGQIFSVDVVLGLDLNPAAITGDLAQTVDYGTLAERVHEIITGEPVDLIETLTLRIVTACLASDRVRWARVTVHKPEAPIQVTFTNVAVTMERSST